MKQLTEKQLKFVKFKAEGLTNEKAMIAAGYSPGGAKQAATTLMARDDIKAAIRMAKRERMGPIDRAIDSHRAARGEGPVDESADPKNAMPKEHYDDMLEFLLDMVNNKNFGLTTRAGYAVQLLPYQHARIGEKGKKEKDKEKAEDVANGKTPKRRADGKPKFAPGAPPMLKVVGR